MMTYTKDNRIEQIDRLLNQNTAKSYKEITLASLASATKTKKNKIIATLLHIKKKH